LIYADLTSGSNISTWMWIWTCRWQFNSR